MWFQHDQAYSDNHINTCLLTHPEITFVQTHLTLWSLSWCRSFRYSTWIIFISVLINKRIISTHKTPNIHHETTTSQADKQLQIHTHFHLQPLYVFQSLKNNTPVPNLYHSLSHNYYLTTNIRPPPRRCCRNYSHCFWVWWCLVFQIYRSREWWWFLIYRLKDGICF